MCKISQHFFTCGQNHIAWESFLELMLNSFAGPWAFVMKTNSKIHSKVFLSVFFETHQQLSSLWNPLCKSTEDILSINNREYMNAITGNNSHNPPKGEGSEQEQLASVSLFSAWPVALSHSGLWLLTVGKQVGHFCCLSFSASVKWTNIWTNAEQGQNS